jgi:hypothetical protein
MVVVIYIRRQVVKVGDHLIGSGGLHERTHKLDKCGSKIPLQEKGLSAALCLVAVVPSDFEKSPMIRALVSG